MSKLERDDAFDADVAVASGSDSSAVATPGTLPLARPDEATVDLPVAGPTPAPMLDAGLTLAPSVVAPADAPMQTIDPGTPVAVAFDATIAPADTTPPPAAGAHATCDFTPADAATNANGDPATLAPQATRPDGSHAAASGDEPLTAGFDILDELGRGGMGVVYKARQKGLNRLVALKMVLTRGHASPHELTRFRIEAEAIARLHHPNIVQVYDIGEYEGHPYFSLEYVSGGNLAKKLSEFPLSARTAAQTVRLADAMASAHQVGIIHRDLKPANILLTEDSTPKITDFGLAKKLEEDVGHTQDGSVMGTPSYMAPEQAAGKNKEVGPLADVYSLGAIFYDTLTGRPPFRGDTVVATLTQVQTLEPVPPKRLQPGVPRDLETICLKCLEKNPTRRYPSAAALRDDLDRYLAGEPIAARPTPAWERAAKWVRRRPTTAALIAVSVLALLGLTAGGLLFAQQEAQRAEQETLRAEEANQLRQQADVQRDQAEFGFRKAREAVEQMLTRVGQERLAHEPRLEKVRRDLLEDALRFYQDFAQVKSADPDVQREIGRASVRVGDIRGWLGQFAEAETAYRSALQRLEAEPSDSAAQPTVQRDLAASHNNLANLLKDTGRHAEAEREYRAALALRRKLSAAEPNDRETQRTLAAGLHNLGLLQQTLGQSKEAEASLREGLQLQEKLVQAEPMNAAYRQELARSLNSLGLLLQAGDRFDETRASFDQARTLLQKLSADAPDHPDYREELALSNDHLGNLLRDTRPKEAAEAYRHALTVREKLAADFPSVPLYRKELAASYNHQGILFQALGQRAAAEKAFQRALELKEKLAADFPKAPDFRRDLANGYNNHGILLQTANRLPEAEKAYQHAVATFETLSAEHPNVPEYREQLARACLNLGTLLQATGRAADAEKRYRQALELRTALAEQHPVVLDYQHELARTHLNLATLHQLNGQGAPAEVAYRQALTRFSSLVAQAPNVPDYQHELGIGQNNLGNLLRALNRPKEAEAVWDQAHQQFAKLVTAHPANPAYRQELARTENELGILYASTGRPKEAESIWLNALKERQKLAADFPDMPTYQQELACSHGNLGVLLTASNRFPEVEANYRTAIQLLAGLEERYPKVASYRHDLLAQNTNLGLLYNALKRWKDAGSAWQQVVTLREKQAAEAPKTASAELAGAYRQLGTTFLQRNKLAEAEHAFATAIAKQQTALAASPQSAPFQQGLRACHLDRIEAARRTDEHRVLARVVREAVPAFPPAQREVTQLAAALAQCVTLAANDKTLAQEERTRLAQSYGKEAVALLERATRDGNQETAGWWDDAALAPLQARDDFKALKPKTK